MELIQVVDAATGNILGEAVPRPEIFAKQLWCMTTNVFIMNDKGEVLCHQRSLEKERMPGMWSTHLGGHVGHEESYEENALKELEEEAGIHLTSDQIHAWRRTKVEKARLWIMEYVAIWNGDVAELIPQPGEVERFAWKSLDQILAEEAAHPDGWCTGTHHFATEYLCMRSVLGAFHHGGHIEVTDHYHTWWPDEEITPDEIADIVS